MAAFFMLFDKNKGFCRKIFKYKVEVCRKISYTRIKGVLHE